MNPGFARRVWALLGSKVEKIAGFARGVCFAADVLSPEICVPRHTIP